VFVLLQLESFLLTSMHFVSFDFRYWFWIYTSNGFFFVLLRHYVLVILCLLHNSVWTVQESYIPSVRKYFEKDGICENCECAILSVDCIGIARIFSGRCTFLAPKSWRPFLAVTPKTQAVVILHSFRKRTWLKIIHIDTEDILKIIKVRPMQHETS